MHIAQFYEVMQKEGIGPRSERIKRLGKMFKMSGRSVEKALSYVRKQVRLAGISSDAEYPATTYFAKTITGEYVPPHGQELWAEFGPEAKAAAATRARIDEMLLLRTRK